MIALLAVATVVVWSNQILATEYVVPAEELEIPTDSAAVAEGRRLASEERWADLRTLPMGDDVPAAVFSDTVAVYLRGSAATLDSIAAATDPADWEVIGDDLTFYRATAYELLQGSGRRLVTFEGRPRLAFVVDGETEILDLTPFTTIDLVILYEPGGEPRVAAPIGVDAAFLRGGTAG